MIGTDVKLRIEKYIKMGSIVKVNSQLCLNVTKLLNENQNAVVENPPLASHKSPSGEL